jgi:hypothetical protein
MRWFCVIFLNFFFVPAPEISLADTLELPTGPIVLRVAGNVTTANVETATVFDLKMLKSLGTVSFSSKTEWTDGTPTFTGVPLKALIEKVGASGTEILAMAADGYAISIPMTDVDRYSILLVYAIDGQELDVADKGPLWVMYRWDQMSPKEIEDKSPNAVWQLQQLKFE